MSLLIKNGRVLDPAGDLDAEKDVLIEDGRIISIGSHLEKEGAEVMDAKGKVVAPGFIDMHVHLRDPGLEYKEDIESGTAAAAAGGFTGVACMANTKPVNDTASVTKTIIQRASQVGHVAVYPIAAITKGLEGKELAEIGDLIAAGAVAISDDGHPVGDPRMMRRALEYASHFDIPLIEHSETPELHPGGVMNEGYWSTALGLRGIPSASEDMAVRRDISLTELTEGRLHIAHLSTRGALEAVRDAKKVGIRVTCEVTPHHLFLTDEAVKEYDTQAKMAPPLRSEEDRAALIEGLADGTIDAIVTDHAPHHADEKLVEFDNAAFGIVGLETAVPLCLDRLVRRNVISISRLIELLSTNPARILGLKKGRLTEGADADVTLLDLDRSHTVDPENFRSKGRNTPFGGWELTGQAVATIVGGKVVWRV